LARKILSVLPQQQAGVVTALITGHRKGMSDYDYKVMRDAGLAHFLAISGLHVGLVSGVHTLLLGPENSMRVETVRGVSVKRTWASVWPEKRSK